MPFFGGGGDYHIVGTEIKGGVDALTVSTGDYNIALGDGALQYNTTGNDNIALGATALQYNTTGNDNIGIGYQALNSIFGNSDNNIAIGSNSILSLTSSYNNIAIGYTALRHLGDSFTGLNDNIAIGAGAGVNGVRHSKNLLIGTNAGLSLATLYNDTDNIFIGYQAGYNFYGLNNAATNNILIGNNACDASNDADNVLAIGHNTVNAGSYSDTILIGNSVTATAANQIIIGNSSHTSVVVGNVTLSGVNGAILPSAIIGDPGTEGSGIDVNGVTYNSTFKVSDIDGTNYAQTILHRHSTVLEPLIVGARANSNTSAHADVTSGMGLFSVYAVGYAGTNYKIFGTEQFAADDTGTISDTSAPGKWTLSLTPDGAITPSPILVVKNDGRIGGADSDADAGPLLLSGGNSLVNGQSGSVTITGGNSLVNGNAGSVAIWGGESTSGNGGSISLVSGWGSGGTVNGSITISSPVGSEITIYGDGNLGFFGGSAGQQTITGSRGGNAALASLLTALAALGLIIDGTTA